MVQVEPGLGPTLCTRPPQQIRLADSDLRAALDALYMISEGCATGAGFARNGVAALSRLVSSELTTLSICNLETGHRTVVSDRPGAISKRQIEVFDHYFYEHPLVREHGRNPNAVTKAINDLMPESQFEQTPLFNDYYRPIRIDHAMAMPIHVDGNLLVSFVFNRSKPDFSDRDRACLELIRPHLGNFYRLTCAMDSARAAFAPPARPGAGEPPPLTAREREVLQWLAGGKTDRDIGEILGISPRTVHKHLQRIYEKLGVETRTAAVMRVISARN